MTPFKSMLGCNNFLSELLVFPHMNKKCPSKPEVNKGEKQTIVNFES